MPAPADLSRGQKLKWALSSPSNFHQYISLADSSRLLNEDLSPSPPARQTWSIISYLTFWWSESWNVSTWSVGEQFASALYDCSCANYPGRRGLAGYYRSYSSGFYTARLLRQLVVSHHHRTKRSCRCEISHWLPGSSEVDFRDVRVVLLCRYSIDLG